MRIKILSRYQNKNLRGVETFVLELSKRLSKNHQVMILTGKDSDDFQKIISGKFDVVMAMNGRSQSLKASLGRFAGGYKLVIGGHSGVGRDDMWNIVVAKPDVFVALTEFELVWAKKFAWGSKLVKIPNGIDLERFKPAGEKLKIDLPAPVILSVGALEWYKHHEKVIKAISKLEEGSLLIVGQGSEKNALESLGSKLLKDRFKIMVVPYDDMPKVYRAADLFTLPSWDREAFGIVYLEAMATNIPVVAPNDLSRREIIGDGGILVDIENLEGYSEALKKALEVSWGNKPRKQAEKFSWDRVAKEYERCFQALVN